MSTEPAPRRSIVAAVVEHFASDPEARRLYERAKAELAADKAAKARKQAATRKRVKRGKQS